MRKKLATLTIFLACQGIIATLAGGLTLAYYFHQQSLSTPSIPPGGLHAWLAAGILGIALGLANIALAAMASAGTAEEP